MEQTKAKTAKEISVAAYIYANENWSDDFRKISAHSYMAGYIAAQSHIANLEAQNKELREALNNVILAVAEKDAGVSYPRLMKCQSIAIKALKENK